MQLVATGSLCPWGRVDWDLLGVPARAAQHHREIPRRFGQELRPAVLLRPQDHFAERPFGGRDIALGRPEQSHDAQVLGIVDRVGDEAAQLADRVQVLAGRIQLAAGDVHLRPLPQCQRFQRSLAYHDTAYCEKWVSNPTTRFPAGSSLDG